MNIKNQHLAILASNLITIGVTFPETKGKVYKFLACKDDAYKIDDYAIVEANGRHAGSIKDSKSAVAIVQVVSIDEEPDIDIEREYDYRFAIGPVNWSEYEKRIEQLDMASQDIGKQRRNAAKHQIVQAMLGDSVDSVRGLSFSSEKSLPSALTR